MDFKTIKRWPLVMVFVFALLCEQSFAAKLVRIPLTKVTTDKAGKQGQSVTSYYAPIAIGSPQVKFNLQFELALDSTFVPHKSYNFFKSYLNYGNGFKCKASFTCIKVDSLLSIEYQQCTLTGKLYEDLITFGTASVETSQLANNSSNNHPSAVANGVIVRQNFLAISDASTPVFKDLPIDGFIGLAPNLVSNSKVYNIILRMEEARIIDRLQFSLGFNRTDSPNGNAELTLGGFEPSRYIGSLNWHRVDSTSENAWALNLRHVSLGVQVIDCNGDCRVSFSSALNGVYGPKACVDKIYDYLGANNPKADETLTLLDCRRLNSNTLPTITFIIDDRFYQLKPKDYIKQAPDSLYGGNTCYIAIFPNEGQPKRWILGTNFLESYYTVFDVREKIMALARPSS